MIKSFLFHLKCSAVYITIRLLIHTRIHAYTYTDIDIFCITTTTTRGLLYGLAPHPKLHILRRHTDRISHLYEVYYKQLRLQERMVQCSTESVLHSILQLLFYP